MGLLFVGCFLLAFFLVWTLVIGVFKCFVQGFLAGEPFLSPHAYNKLADPEDVKDWESHPRRVRFGTFKTPTIHQHNTSRRMNTYTNSSFFAAMMSLMLPFCFFNNHEYF